MTKKELIERLCFFKDESPIFVPVDCGNGEIANLPILDVAIDAEGTALILDFTEIN